MTSQRLISSLVALLTVLGSSVSPTLGQQADLVLRGGKVVTMDDATPEAQAIAVIGDRIAAERSTRDPGVHRRARALHGNRGSEADPRPDDARVLG